MKKILLTCFEPFGGSPVNASEQALGEFCARLRSSPIDGAEIAVEVLPVAFAAGTRALAEAVSRHQPDAIVGFGEDTRRRYINVETRGINQMHARIADNSGDKPRKMTIDASPSAPGSRELTFPADPLVQAVGDAGLKAVVSTDAGSFVCNTLAYLLPEFGVPAAFIHLPALRQDNRDIPGAGSGSRPDGQAPRGPAHPHSDPGRLRAPATIGDLATAVAAIVAVVAADTPPTRSG
ncbi:hypothetical protein JZY06_10900 [Corynebacterium sp. CCM 8862]|uniref:Pyroglutamyl-peptidase I n=1 Tax=Corynebacterium mendelii TaxID=2765362 RepID=A0A939IWB3_9CORY|nr:hypothetical protein [Corynebacterium mendelii]